MSPISYVIGFGSMVLFLLICLFQLIRYFIRKFLLVNPSHDLEASQHQYDRNNQDVADDQVALPPVSAPRTTRIQVVAYDGPGKTKFLDDECMICLAKFEDGEVCQALVNCMHVYHVECIEEWISRSLSCPICRAPVLIRVFIEVDLL